MNLLVFKQFEKDVKKLRDKKVASSLYLLLEKIKLAKSLAEIPHLKKMAHPGNYYRVRLGDYRLGVKVENDTIFLLRFMNRKEIYRYFP